MTYGPANVVLVNVLAAGENTNAPPRIPRPSLFTKPLGVMVNAGGKSLARPKLAVSGVKAISRGAFVTVSVPDPFGETGLKLSSPSYLYVTEYGEAATPIALVANEPENRPVPAV